MSTILRVPVFSMVLLCGSAIAQSQPAGSSATSPAANVAVTTETAENEADRATMLVVVGASGTEEYAEQFREWAELWRAAAAASELDYRLIGLETVDEDRQQLKSILEEEARKTSQPLWMILIGHGTFDRDTAKFNLRGPDVSAKELGDWVRPCQRPLIVVNCSSSSGPFLSKLNGPDRVVITATNSGAELNYARFGKYLAESWTEPEADLDHDQQTSLLEAFLYASSRVARFYESESRLATEHALIDDNQDGKGTSADFFVGIRAAAKSKDGASPDGRRAHRYILVPPKDLPQLTAEQIETRDRLEEQIEMLRDRKKQLSEDDYYAQLEAVMVKLAALYAEAN